MMRLRNKVLSILKDKSGASLMFVLGIMLLLLAIGGSVLVAASTNVGANVRQEKYNAAVILTDSIHRSIKYSLEEVPESTDYPDSNFESSLAYQIARGIYDSFESPQGSIELNADILEIDMSNIKGITLEFSYQDIRFAGPVDAVPETDPPTPRIPRTATINAQMDVRVVVEVESASLRDAPRYITSIASYELRDCVLSDTNVNGDVGEMEFSNFGKWVLMSYEIIESKAIEK